ncbi:MAG TPA: TIGR03618 family F420-dependent PPOX class oxidoreductase [Actinomycetota bacterium]|nr:TIGR03618 family F420-dependent PPOX class oxidoreductase [Actinomycetota bacterium]
MSPRRDVSMTPTEVETFLLDERTAVLTTLDREGWPHSTAMWFVIEPEGIVMWTYAKSQKVKNLQRDPRCAVLVEAGASYGSLRGVLVRGRAVVSDDFGAVREVGLALFRRYNADDGSAPVAGPALEEIERQAGKRVRVTVPFEDVASWDHSKL